MKYHVPVLLKEVLEHLKIKQGGKYIDATLGDGGHTLEILRLGGLVLGIDLNEGSRSRASRRIQEAGLQKNFTLAKGNFRDIEKLATDHEYTGVEGILFDLGVSTSELEDGSLGLSFKSNAELDMRLSSELGVKAFDLVNGLYERELEELFRSFGEEHFAKKFARLIVESRSLKRISTAAELAELAEKSFPGYERGRIHPATRIFQALRIAVNSEFENLQDALPQAGRLLLPGGRMAVISFHSLEDRIVKQFGKAAQPNLTEVTDKPVVASEEELADNPSSRSAKLRVFEKL